MVYFDTSAVVPLLLPETSSGAMQAWVAGNNTATLVLSDWTLTECASALGLRFRAHALAEPAVAAAWVKLQQHVGESFAVLAPTRSDFELAAALILRLDLGLRAGDALHVAIAQNAGADSFVTLDKRLAAAAAQLGLAVETPA